MSKEIIKYIKEYNKIERTLYDECSLFVKDSIINVKCIWDTGASSSCISSQLISQLRLESVTPPFVVRSSGGVYSSACYNIDVAFYSEIIFNVYANSYNNCENGMDFLIGMDIISKGKFIVDKM